MSTSKAVLVLCVGGLCACDGTPGEARIELYEPASGEPRWRYTLPSQEFSAEEGSAEGTLLVHTSDLCWDANYSMEFEQASGKLSRRWKRQPEAGTGGAPTQPGTTRCESGFAAQRAQLSNNETVHVCGYTEDGVLTVLSTRDGSERLRLAPDGRPLPLVAGDLLLLTTLEPAGVDAYSLLSGERQWSWAAPDVNTYVEAIDAERVYLLSLTGTDTIALALADGSVVWQNDLACDSLSLAGDALVCHQTLRRSSCELE
jgi:hypothetical protein